MKTAKNEHRRLERFGLGLPSQVQISEKKGADKKEIEAATEDEAVLTLETRDVCAGGAFFRTDQVLSEGTEVAIDLVLPLDELKKLEGRKTLIKVSGKVIRSEDEGMAIQFNKRFKMVPMTNEEGSETA